jgi:hypothetical protein
MKNIWSPLIQKFPNPEAGAVFFFANQDAKKNMPSSSMRTSYDVNAGLSEKTRMRAVMGNFQYTLAVVDITTITEDQLTISAQEIDRDAFVKFGAWMKAEFPYCTETTSITNPSASLFVLRDFDLIKFRFMFQYVK